MILKWPNLAAITFAAAMVTSCATPQPMPVPPSGPVEWISHIDLSEPECVDIDGAFENHGLRRHENGKITEDGLLAEHVFSRQLPRRQAARAVSIASNIEAGWLDATLLGGISRDISFAVSCRDGWYLFIETQTTRFLGENVQAGQFEQQSYFRLDRDGRLVARVLSNAAYRTDFQEVTRESSETWYRFEPAAR